MHTKNVLATKSENHVSRWAEKKTSLYVTISVPGMTLKQNVTRRGPNPLETILKPDDDN